MAKRDSSSSLGYSAFMSVDYTNALRAIAILMVMTSHLSGFIFNSRVFTPFGGGGVAVFQIVSGYGLTLSAQHKGLKCFWRKKAIRVLLPWLVVWTLGAMLHLQSFDWMKFAASLFLLNEANWYLQYLFVCYVAFYVSYRFFYKYRWPLLVVVHLLVFACWGNIQAEQSVSFLIGVMLAEKSALKRYVDEHSKIICFGSVLLFVVALGMKQMAFVRNIMESNTIAEHGLNLVLKTALAMIVVAGLKGILQFVNEKVCRFVGRISYELYLVHLFLVVGLCNAYVDGPYLKIVAFCVLSFGGAYLLYLFDNSAMARYNRKPK